MKVIDFHAHIFPGKVADKATDFLSDYYGYHMMGNGRVSGLLESAEEYHVEKMIVHSSATKPQQVRAVNDFVAEEAKKHEQFVGFGTVHPDYEDIAGEADRLISLGLKGIKLHPVFQGFAIDSDGAMKIYETIEGRLPLLIHVGDETVDLAAPKRLARVLDEFPKLTVIAAHLGGYKEWDQAEKYLVGRNVYFDTSSSVRFMPREDALRIINNHGVDKIVFGTDFPLCKHQGEVQLIEELGLTGEELEMILYTNAKKLLNL